MHRSATLLLLLLAPAFTACASPPARSVSEPVPTSTNPAVRAGLAALRHLANEVAHVSFSEVKSETALPAASTPPNELLAPDIGGIVARRRLRVAMLGSDNPPFFRHDAAGKLQGLDVDLARDVAVKLGVELSIDTAPKTFDGVIHAVAAGIADIGISKLSQTLRRSEMVRFTRPYVALHRGLLVNRLELAKRSRGADVVSLIQHFDGRLGVIRGSSYAAYARSNFPHATIVPFATWKAEVEAVKSGTIVAAFRDELEIKNVVERDPSAALVFASVVFTDALDPVAIAVPVRSDSLLAFINEMLGSDRLTDLPVDAIIAAFPNTVP